MKVTRSEAEQKNVIGPMDAPEYPWGLKLSLDEEALKKLALGEMPAVGTKLKIEANVEVCDVSQYESKEGGVRRSLSLQITDLGLGAADAPVNHAQVMYGEKK